MAHEWGHIVQYQRGIRWKTTKPLELQVEYLAGWYMAARNPRNMLVFTQAMSSFFSKGDYEFNEPDHHGTPEERVQAIQQGFRDGNLSLSAVIKARLVRLVEYQLLLARDLKLIRPEDYEKFSEQTVEIKRMLTVLIPKLIAES
jgi:hypothetical protein